MDRPATGKPGWWDQSKGDWMMSRNVRRNVFGALVMSLLFAGSAFAWTCRYCEQVVIWRFCSPNQPVGFCTEQTGQGCATAPRAPCAGGGDNCEGGRGSGCEPEVEASLSPEAGFSSVVEVCSTPARGASTERFRYTTSKGRTFLTVLNGPNEKKQSGGHALVDSEKRRAIEAVADDQALL